jgi:hypothetical protein
VPGIGLRNANRVIFYIMEKRWPAPGMVVDHISRDVTDNRWVNLRECTSAQNNQNIDRTHTRSYGRDLVMEQGVRLTNTGRYSVDVMKVHYGTFKSRHEANELVRRIRREVKGEFDVPFVTTRRYWRPAP